MTGLLAVDVPTLPSDELIGFTERRVIHRTAADIWSRHRWPELLDDFEELDDGEAVMVLHRRRDRPTVNELVRVARLATGNPRIVASSHDLGPLGSAALLSMLFRTGRALAVPGGQLIVMCELLAADLPEIVWTKTPETSAGTFRQWYGGLSALPGLGLETRVELGRRSPARLIRTNRPPVSEPFSGYGAMCALVSGCTPPLAEAFRAAAAATAARTVHEVGGGRLGTPHQRVLAEMVLCPADPEEHVRDLIGRVQLAECVWCGAAVATPICPYCRMVGSGTASRSVGYSLPVPPPPEADRQARIASVLPETASLP